MNRHPHPPTRQFVAHSVLRRASNAIKGIAAAVVLLGLLAGVPYVLARGFGSPLPAQWPALSQVKATLTGAFTDRTLLDTLAYGCWFFWGVFVISTLRALPDAVHNATNRQLGDGSRGERSGPLRAVATVLVATIITGLFTFRAHSLPVTAKADLTGWPPRTAVVLNAAQASMPTTHDGTSLETRAMTDDTTVVGSVTVQPPHAGIHDSLWRIAARRLGDGARWPEIFRLNKGIPQPDGEALTRPSLIEPGWVLQLPGTQSATSPNVQAPATGLSTPSNPAPAPTSPTHATPTLPTNPAPAPSPSVTELPSEQAPPAPQPVLHTAGHSSGIAADEALLGLGLAAAVSTALLTARRRRRRAYVPGSGYRDDLMPVAPIVRSLHLSHLTLLNTTTLEPDDNTPPSLPLSTPAASAHTHTADRGVPTGVLDGCEVAIDLAGLHGLGLVGPGAAGTARALLLHALTHHNTTDHEGPIVLVPADTATQLRLPDPSRWPAQLRLVPDLAAALDEAETALLRHARHTAESSKRDGLGVVIVTSVPTDTRRLQAITDTGTTTGVGAVLLGQWRPGSSAYLAADGTVTATSPGPAEPLRGARLFHLTAPDTAQILATLHAAAPPVKEPTVINADSKGLPQPSASTEPAEPENTVSRAQGVDPVVDVAPTADAAQTQHRPAGAELSVQPVNAAKSESNDQANDHSSRSASDTPTPPAALRLNVLGPVRLSWPQPTTGDDGAGRDARDTAAVGTAGVDLTGAVSGRLRELLVLLALHPEGLTRDRLADTLWPDTSADRPYATLNTNLARLRRAIATATNGQVSEITTTSGDRHLLNPAVVTTDYTMFSSALAACRTAQDDSDRASAYRQVIAAYSGELAEGLAAEWLETPREAARRDAVDAASSLARLSYDSDPRATLNMLETARVFDPYNEAIYRDIMRLQRRLGQHDAIERTLTLLTTKLSELDETPESETLLLVDRLRHLDAAS